MNKTFQIRNFPVAIISKLKVLASRKQMTLSELVIAELTSATQEAPTIPAKVQPTKPWPRPKPTLNRKPTRSSFDQGHAANCMCYACKAKKGKGGK